MSRQAAEGWGSAVVPRLARDLAVEFPSAKGYSERNLWRMLQFFNAYPALAPPQIDSTELPPAAHHSDVGTRSAAPAIIPPQAVAELPE